MRSGSTESDFFSLMMDDLRLIMSDLHLMKNDFYLEMNENIILNGLMDHACLLTRKRGFVIFEKKRE